MRTLEEKEATPEKKRVQYKNTKIERRMWRMTRIKAAAQKQQDRVQDWKIQDWKEIKLSLEAEKQREV